MPVTYPQVEETLKRSLYGVIAPYFSATGVSTQQISGTNQDFYRASVEFDIVKVNTQMDRASIVITGARTTAVDYKVNDPKFVKVWGGRQRQERASRTVFVSIPKSLKMAIPPYNNPAAVQQASLRDADRIWGQLMLICMGLQDRWAQENIYQMELEATPRQLTDPDYFILSGTMSFQLRYEYTR